jgi:hypothetical protein
MDHRPNLYTQNNLNPHQQFQAHPHPHTDRHPPWTSTLTFAPGQDIFYVFENLLRPDTGPVSIHIGSLSHDGPYFLRGYNSVVEWVKILGDGKLTYALDLWYQRDGTNVHDQPVASGVYLIYLRRPMDVQV